MKDYLFIEKLIARLRNKSVSPNDLKELSKEFEQDKPSENINRYLLNIWDTSPKFPSDLDQDRMLSLLHQKLELDEKSTNRSGGNSLFVRKATISILKYAAVFILAFSIAWMFKSGKHKGQISASTDYPGMNEIMVSYGSKSKILLPDGSIVNLNSGSKLIYPAVFSDKAREVFLDGEAHFNVKANSAHPFFVNTSDISIRVLGTVFNVKSYPESNTIVTTLVSGSLEIKDIKNSLLSMKKTNPVVLKPNQKAVFIKDINKLTVTDKEELKSINVSALSKQISLQENVDTHILTAWKDNLLIFDNEYFESLAIKLERWYNVTIEIKSPDLKQERFTGKFENETIEQVLNALKIAEPFDYTIIKNHIEIYRK